MKSSASTPTAYIAALPVERQGPVRKLRQVLRKHLPKGFEETVDYGMIAYVVPHSLYPGGYHVDRKRPLPFINLASQKQYVALYHMGLYDGPLLTWFRRQWPQHTEAKLDLGKSCVRLKKLDQIPYPLIAELAAKMTPADWIAAYERSRR